MSPSVILVSGAGSLAQMDPHGWILTLISISIVFLSLLVLYVVYSIAGGIASGQFKEQIEQRKLRRSEKRKSCILSAVIKAVAAIVLGYCCMATSNPIIWNLGYLPIIVHAVLLCDACADFVELLISRLSRRRQYSAKTAEILSVVLSVLYIGYGTVNMQTIVPSEHVYVSDNVKTEHTFVFFSDLKFHRVCSFRFGGDACIIPYFPSSLKPESA